MRLNLGEIAGCLGCGPGNVIWDGPSKSGNAGRGVVAPPAGMKELAARRTAAGKTPGGDACGALNWSFAPWAETEPTGAQIDSRKIRPGNLFFCLPGDNTDGHDFAHAATAAGASAIIASRNPFVSGGEGAGEVGTLHAPVFLVPDVTRALWRLAMCHRDTSPARIIGLTGTAGKTSVKEVLAQVLEVRGSTDRNPMNLNNQIGLPLSMLNASASSSFWVMEMGISLGHDMDELGSILRPDLGIILNVGEGHTAGLGDQGVAAYKARLLDYIQPGGMAIVSADYPELNEQVEKRRIALAQKGIQVLRFSARDQSAYCYARYLGPSGTGGGQYFVSCESESAELSTPFRSDYGSENVAAIVATVHKLSLNQSETKAALATATLPDQRFRAIRYPDFTILDDSYNANPLSSKRMLAAAQDMAREYEQPLVLVMGEMLELGDIAEKAHEGLGREMARVKPEVIFWKGGQASAVQKGLAAEKYAGPFYPVGAGHDFSLLLDEMHLPKALVLFKGSRSNRIELLVDIFRQKVAPGGEIDAV